MIVGLKFKITSTELRTHCSERAKYHSTRADQKEAEIHGLEKAMATLVNLKSTSDDDSDAALALAHMTKFSNSYQMDREDPVGALKRDIQAHRNRSLVFKFYAEHFFDEDYDLKPEDLRTLEILPSGTA